jgi:CHAD domain-containing protein
MKASHDHEPSESLHAGMRSDQALARLLQGLLDTMRSHESGIIRESDVESLHDFRVAVRRARVLLVHIKKVLRKQDAQTLQAGLDWLASVTGPCRDLDVWLEIWPDYLALMPENQRHDLASVRSYLRKRRQKCYGRMVRQLKSTRYRKLIQHWQAVAQTGYSAKEKHAGRDVAVTANRAMARRWKKLMQRGEKIDLESSARKYHRLRISCKKLRYLLSAFSDLYPLDDVKFLVTELKTLQNILGSCQDMEVHMQSLHELVASMAGENLMTVDTRCAIYELLGQLQAQTQKRHVEFSRAFVRFAGIDVQQRFVALLES